MKKYETPIADITFFDVETEILINSGVLQDSGYITEYDIELE